METSGIFKKSITTARESIKKRAFFAYNTNLDSVVLIGASQARTFFQYLPELAKSMRRGEGKEIRVSASLFQKIIGLIKKSSQRIGGQAGNMAMDAANLGVECYLHTPSKSKELLSLFGRKGVLVAAENGFLQAQEAKDSSEPPIHLIFEYTKGRGIPSSNRFIVSSESLNPTLFIDPVFSRGIAREIPGIDRGFIAGFHLLSPEVFRKRSSFVAKQVSGWKKANPELRIHLEWGSFISNETENLVGRQMLPLVDSVGFNGEEIEFREEGKVEKLLRKTKTVLVHGKDYSVAFSKEFSSKTLELSLSFASAVAGFKAMKGRAPTFAELAKTSLKPKKINPPKFNSKKLAKWGISFAFSPSAEIVPKHTIGLGDCFSMAFFLTLKK
ncbi:MAG: ADP-dependent glucokinase/phosphofructokinase [Candidatus Micrarchaeota archaeon]